MPPVLSATEVNTQKPAGWINFQLVLLKLRLWALPKSRTPPRSRGARARDILPEI